MKPRTREGGSRFDPPIIRRFEFYTSLTSGTPPTTAEGKFLYWNGSDYVTETNTFDVYDPTGSVNADAEEVGWVIWRKDTQHWELLTGFPNPYFKIGVLDSDLAYRSSATMSVYTGAGGSETDSGENITVWDWLLSPGDSIPAGSNVIAGWNGFAWYVFAAECPDAGSS